MPKQQSIFTLITVLCLALWLAACGSNQTDTRLDPQAGPTSTVVTVEDAPAVSESPAGEDAQAEPSQPEQEPPTASAESDVQASPAEPGAERQTNTTQSNAQQPALAGEIVLWHSWAGAEGDALAEILQDFNTRYPGVQVDTLFVAHDDLLQSYAEAVFAESGPTVLLAPNWWLGEMVLLQLLVPFGPELVEATLDGLFPAALESMTWNDTLYGVPMQITVPAVYVNTALYDDELPATLDEWYALARTEPKLGIGLYANLYHLAWGLAAYDARLFDEHGKVVLDEHPGTLEFLNWLRSVDALDGSYVDQDYGMLLDRYKAGEFAFFVDGPWSYGDLSAVFEGSITVQPLPAGPGGPSAPWLYADGLFLNPNTDDAARRIAVTFAQHLAGPSAGEILVGTGNLVPANLAAGPPAEHNLSGFHTQSQWASAMPTRQEMDAVWGYGGDMIIRALLGYPELDDAELQAALAELVTETATLINEANGR